MTRIHLTYEVTHLSDIIKVDDQFHLLTVSNVCQLLGIGKDLFLVSVSIKFSQELLDLFYI